MQVQVVADQRTTEETHDEWHRACLNHAGGPFPHLTSTSASATGVGQAISNSNGASLTLNSKQVSRMWGNIQAKQKTDSPRRYTMYFISFQSAVIVKASIQLKFQPSPSTSRRNHGSTYCTHHVNPHPSQTRGRVFLSLGNHTRRRSIIDGMVSSFPRSVSDVAFFSFEFRIQKRWISECIVVCKKP